MFSLALLKKLRLSLKLLFYSCLASTALCSANCAKLSGHNRDLVSVPLCKNQPDQFHNLSPPQPPPYSSFHQYLLILVSTSICLFHRLLSLKIAVIKKTELTKKLETQMLSPSKRSAMKPAIRQTRPNQHHSCPRRRTTGDPLSRSVAQGGALCCCFSASVSCFAAFFLFSLSAFLLFLCFSSQ